VGRGLDRSGEGAGPPALRLGSRASLSSAARAGTQARVYETSTRRWGWVPRCGREGGVRLGSDGLAVPQRALCGIRLSSSHRLGHFGFTRARIPEAVAARKNSQRSSLVRLPFPRHPCHDATITTLIERLWLGWRVRGALGCDDKSASRPILALRICPARMVRPGAPRAGLGVVVSCGKGDRLPPTSSEPGQISGIPAPFRRWKMADFPFRQAKRTPQVSGSSGRGAPVTEEGRNHLTAGCDVRGGRV
jgi:hypothetical protein